MTTYRYIPFPPVSEPKDISIRLLTLPPGPRTGPISCTITETRLVDAPEYEVLSYCWGDHRDQSSIYVTSIYPLSPLSSPRLKEELIRIPSSLVPFLYRTRAIGKARTFWIDSICIDQSNDIEKSIQVARMRDIYQRASCTLIWLGPAGDNSDEALHFAWKLCKKVSPETDARASISGFEEGNGSPETHVGDPRLEALLRLAERPYFERAWIVQEVAVSRNPWVLCGDRAVHWYVYMTAFIHLITADDWIWDFYSDRGLLLVMILRFSQSEWEGGRDVEWWRILTRHRQSRAGDPRDKVFAFWGMRCKADLESMGIVPDYGMGIEELYIRVAVQALRKGDVQILSVPRIVIRPHTTNAANIEATKIDESLKPLAIPSWVPDWRSTPKTAMSLTQLETTNLVIKLPFESSLSSRFNPTFNAIIDSSRYNTYCKLKLEGYIVARVSQLTPRPWSITKPIGHQTIFTQAHMLRYNQQQIWEWESVIRLSESQMFIYRPTGESSTQAMYKTLTMGTQYQNSEMQTRQSIAAFENRQWWLRRLFKYGFGDRLWAFAAVVLSDRLWRWCGWQSPEMKFRMMVGGMTERKGARSIGERARDGGKEGGMLYLGLVPGICEQEDVVVLCKGVKVPLVLRRKVGGENEVGVTEEWELIGDCYVHGVMKGEVWDESRCQDLWLV